MMVYDETMTFVLIFRKKTTIFDKKSYKSNMIVKHDYFDHYILYETYIKS